MDFDSLIKSKNGKSGKEQLAAFLSNISEDDSNVAEKIVLKEESTNQPKNNNDSSKSKVEKVTTNSGIETNIEDIPNVVPTLSGNMVSRENLNQMNQVSADNNEVTFIENYKNNEKNDSSFINEDENGIIVENTEEINSKPKITTKKKKVVIKIPLNNLPIMKIFVVIFLLFLGTISIFGIISDSDLSTFKKDNPVTKVVDTISLKTPTANSDSNLVDKESVKEIIKSIYTKMDERISPSSKPSNYQSVKDSFELLNSKVKSNENKVVNIYLEAEPKSSPTIDSNPANAIGLTISFNDKLSQEEIDILVSDAQKDLNGKSYEELTNISYLEDFFSVKLKDYQLYLSN